MERDREINTERHRGRDWSRDVCVSVCVCEREREREREALRGLKRLQYTSERDRDTRTDGERQRDKHRET